MERTVRPVITKRLDKFLSENYSIVLLFVCAYLLTTLLILLSHTVPNTSLYRVGESSKETYRSEYGFSYDDKFETEDLAKTIEINKPMFYSYQENHEAAFYTNLQQFLSLIKAQSDRDFIKNIKTGGYKFSSSALNYLTYNRMLISLYTNRLIYLYQALTSQYFLVNNKEAESKIDYIELITMLGNKKIGNEKLLLCPLEKDFLINFIGRIYTGMSIDLKDIMAEIMINIIEPTAVQNPKVRAEVIQKELNLAKQHKFINKGDFLINKGDVINQDNLAKIIAYSEYKKNDLKTKIWVYNILCLLILVFLSYRFIKYEKETFKKKYNIYIALIGFIAVNFIFYSTYLYNDFPSVPVFLLVPFAIISISLPLLLNNDRVSIILLISYCFFSFFYPIFDIITFFNLIIISLSTIYTSQLLKNRNDFFIVALFIGFIELFFSFIYFFFNQSFPDMRDWGIIILFALGNGFISSIVSLGLMPLLENIFNIPTRFRLLELTNPSLSPLLNKLKTEAPGTYNHSLLLGDMCEAAALKLGIDSLLAKAGGYYHDIGKTENSQYFIENQDGKNKHDDIKTSISVSIIKSHTKLGIELSRKYRLPEEIVDAIKEHHGTTAISYFYHQALGLLGDENVNISDYEYPGPKPQSKTTAVLMLADGVETTVRAYTQNNERFTTKIIEDIIDDLIQRRIAQGQLDECDLTLRDLKIVADEFFKFLAGYYHKRIEYIKK